MKRVATGVQYFYVTSIFVSILARILCRSVRRAAKVRKLFPADKEKNGFSIVSHELPARCARYVLIRTSISYIQRLTIAREKENYIFRTRRAIYKAIYDTRIEREAVRLSYTLYGDKQTLYSGRSR